MEELKECRHLPGEDDLSCREANGKVENGGVHRTQRRYRRRGGTSRPFPFYVINAAHSKEVGYEVILEACQLRFSIERCDGCLFCKVRWHLSKQNRGQGAYSGRHACSVGRVVASQRSGKLGESPHHTCVGRQESPAMTYDTVCTAALGCLKRVAIPTTPNFLINNLLVLGTPEAADS